MSLSVAWTAFTYFILYGVIVWIFSSFGILGRFPWGPLALTVFVFLVALLTTIRKRIPDLTAVSWDSATRDEAPSPVYIPSRGGRLWNVNPIGLQTMGSIAAIGSGLFCLGPSIAIMAITSLIEETRKNSQSSEGDNNQ